MMHASKQSDSAAVLPNNISMILSEFQIPTVVDWGSCELSTVITLQAAFH